MLGTETAKILYHTYAAELPVIDYHCHVSSHEIAEDKRYGNITELWLGGDHYKWRAMRSCGISEEAITGSGTDYEKFAAYASVMPMLIGNPLYHWSHLELRRYFGYEGALNADTCDEVWELCNDKLLTPEMSVRNIIKNSRVELLCTTDDPCDSLLSHAAIAADDSFTVKVLPAWRPDKGINIERAGWNDYIRRLSEVSGVAVTDIDSLKAAFIKRLDHFAAHGCLTADHGIDGTVPFSPSDNPSVTAGIFAKALNGTAPDPLETEIFKTEMLTFFGGEYKKRGWVMQFHFGVLRNVSSVMFDKLGPDTGFDIIGGRASITELAGLLGLMEKRGALPRTVLYSVNPSDNAAIGALAGAFQTDSNDGMPRVMQGSAWWFNDNNTGMRRQMTSLANLSSFGRFLGMLTDSRSFISYTRHEYFRRILCDLIGGWAENGEYPADIDSLAELVINICYNNTKSFFRFR